MYKLFYSPGACSLAVHVVLNELAVPFEAINTSITEGKNAAPEYLAINPRGQVPVLMDDAFTLRESAAIIMYLVENHRGTMIPKAGTGRAKCLEWLMFANSTMHPAYGKAFFILRNVPDKVQQEALLRVAIDKINQLWADVDTNLGKNRFICGSEISPVDILLTVFANWNSYFSIPINLGPNVKRLIKDVSSRPAFQKALKTEKVEYKAAA